MILRTASFIFLFLSAVFAPWPVTVGVAIVFAALFSWFWEMVIIGFLLGAMYGFSKGQSGFLFSFFVSVFIAVFFVEESVKRFIEGKNFISYAFTALSGGISSVLLWLIFRAVIYYV